MLAGVPDKFHSCGNTRTADSCGQSSTPTWYACCWACHSCGKHRNHSQIGSRWTSECDGQWCTITLTVNKAHTFVDQAPTDEIIALYKKTNAFVVPTLTVLTSLTGEEQEWRDRFARVAKSKGLITQAQHDTMCEILGAKAESATIEHAYASIRQLKAAGIDVVAGTDAIAGLKGTAIGPSLWQEMAMYVDKCGFTPEEALRSATEAGARRFKFEDRGTVEVGKRADLVLVAGDVTQKLDRLWEGKGVVSVWKEGLLAA